MKLKFSPLSLFLCGIGLSQIDIVKCSFKTNRSVMLLFLVTHFVMEILNGGNIYLPTQCVSRSSFLRNEHQTYDL